MAKDVVPKSKRPLRRAVKGEGKPNLPKGMRARTQIISAAEALFNKQGVDRASMRDIASAARMQPASVYYYFASKDELLWTVWEKGGLELRHRVDEAIAAETDPWQRLEAACAAHVTGLVDWRRAVQVLFILPPWLYPEGIKSRVIELRDGYEQIFVDLIDALPLASNVDRRYLRLSLIGALSWSLFWYKKNGDKPVVIAKKMLAMLRDGIDPR
jgi:AcrR family transcriptional regulator